MIDEEREEELRERDRVGEMAPAEDALFGGRGEVEIVLPDGSRVGAVKTDWGPSTPVWEPKAEPVPPEIAARQRRFYERLVASRRDRR